MFRSATFKLTMWYLAIVMVISLMFSVAVYHFAAGELGSGLQHQTQRIFREYPVFNGNPSFVDRQDNDIAYGEHHILGQLIYFNLLVLLGAGFLSYWLARQTLEPIEAAHERQKRFTADVSHELRTPLTSLKMGSEVALMDKQADKKTLREALESNIDDANKMEQLINSLLRLTKLDTEQSQITFTTVSLKQILQNAHDQVAKKAAGKQVQLKLPVTTLHVQGDADALTQLMVILLDNAIKYSAAAATVTVATQQRDNVVHISVHDEGQGIDPQALPHVFDRFYRADKARTASQTEGFGLGLSIAKMIADRHQGHITLSSQPGKGTTATVTLPVAANNP